MSTFRPMQVIKIAAWTAVLATGGAGEVEAGINVWTSIGPFGGFAHALAIDPLKPDTGICRHHRRHIQDDGWRHELERDEFRPSDWIHRPRTCH